MNPKTALSSNVSYIAEESKKPRIVILASESLNNIKLKSITELSLKQREQTATYGK
jgi:hypothetical protein